MVNDLLTKIREEQDSPFKPATPDELETRKDDLKKERLVALKGRTTDVCPHCGVDLRVEGVWGKEQIWGTVSKYYNEGTEGKPGWWEWGDSNTIESEINSWHCSECEGELVRGKDFEANESIKEAKTPFVPAGEAELAQRKKDAPISAEDFEWYNQLQEIINGYKGGETDPLDGDEVDKLTELIRMKLNYMEGNITREEYQNAPIGD